MIARAENSMLSVFTKMKIVQQATKLPIKDIDFLVGGEGSAKRKHSPLLPNSIRCIVTGPSSCGKSNVLFNLLFDANGLRFRNVYVLVGLYFPKPCIKW